MFVKGAISTILYLMPTKGKWDDYLTFAGKKINISKTCTRLAITEGCSGTSKLLSLEAYTGSIIIVHHQTENK
jgi:hypothetical protein